MGIPCNHQIHQADKEGIQFTLDDFHQQWHIQTDLIPENHTEALPDSITAPTKENNENQYLTDLFNQLPSAFEHQDAKEKMEKGELEKGRGRPRKVVKDVAPIVPKKRGRPSKIREKFDSEESEAKDETGNEDSDADLPEISLEEPGTLTTRSGRNIKKVSFRFKELGAQIKDADKDEAYQPFDVRFSPFSL
ncbi:hypothetical protein KEM48_008776 [Puccinia striiformis f. sp. tritici PST-130]|nr:hypothetical protein KEM48_008776 [Puccinia striiformis f. sp. tritici PST-130]